MPLTGLPFMVSVFTVSSTLVVLAFTPTVSEFPPARAQLLPRFFFRRIHPLRCAHRTRADKFLARPKNKYEGLCVECLAFPSHPCWPRRHEPPARYCDRCDGQNILRNRLC